MDKCFFCDSRPCQCTELFNEIAGEESIIAWQEIIRPHHAEDLRSRTDELEDFIELIRAQAQRAGAPTIGGTG